MESPIQVSARQARSVAQSAQSTPFPWKDAVPSEVSDWFQAYAKSRNTLPEFVFTAALTTIASLMAPRLISTFVRSTLSL